MTPEKQQEFVAQLLTDVTAYILTRADRLPGNWNGIEIREWIADTIREQYVAADCMTPERRRAYLNDRLTMAV
jgi:hypothetical protein